MKPDKLINTLRTIADSVESLGLDDDADMPLKLYATFGNLMVDSIDDETFRLFDSSVPQPKTGPRTQAQVFVYDERLAHSMWIDFFYEDSDGNAILGEELTQKLNEGLEDGSHVGWRFITVHEEAWAPE